MINHYSQGLKYPGMMKFAAPKKNNAVRIYSSLQIHVGDLRKVYMDAKQCYLINTPCILVTAVYTSDGNFQLHSDFLLEFIMYRVVQSGDRALGELL